MPLSVIPRLKAAGLRQSDKKMSGTKLKSFKRLPGFLYRKMVRINDTPQRISLGLALGVLAGLIPGTGPLAAVTLAFIFRVNRFSALLGSLITNTWLSILTLIPAVKLGSVMLNLSWHDLYQDWSVFIKEFHWTALLEASVYKIILPVLLGYVTIGTVIAVSVYLAALSILIYKRQTDKRS
jgi:uncharacterized protein (DUF2062 family)